MSSLLTRQLLPPVLCAVGCIKNGHMPPGPSCRAPHPTPSIHSQTQNN